MQSSKEILNETENSEGASSLFNDEVLFEGLEIVSVENSSSGEDISVEIYLDSLNKRLAIYAEEYKTQAELVSIQKNSEQDQNTNINKATQIISTSCINDVLANTNVEAKLTVETPYGGFLLLVPTTRNIACYAKCFEQVIAKTKQSAVSISALISKKSLNVEKYATLYEEVAATTLAAFSIERTKQRAVRLMLQALLWERLRDTLLEKARQMYSKAEIYLDQTSPGLWASVDIGTSVSLPAARRRPVIPKYKLDDNQIQLLISLIFSTKAREKAAAKLNLFSRLKDNVIRDIKMDSTKVLSEALSETDLTQDEILAVLFIDLKTEQTLCPYCDRSVEMGNEIYHQKCPVITWLIENFFFKYDEERGLLIRQKLTYLNKCQRALLEELEKKTARLSEPFVLKRQGKYAKMKTTSEGLRTMFEVTNLEFRPYIPNRTK